MTFNYCESQETFYLLNHIVKIVLKIISNDTYIRMSFHFKIKMKPIYIPNTDYIQCVHYLYYVKEKIIIYSILNKNLIQLEPATL